MLQGKRRCEQGFWKQTAGYSGNAGPRRLRSNSLTWPRTDLLSTSSSHQESPFTGAARPAAGAPRFRATPHPSPALPLGQQASAEAGGGWDGQKLEKG